MIKAITLSEAISSVDRLKEKNKGIESYKIHILRNVTIEAFVPYLEYELSTAGIYPEVKVGEFDQIINETLMVGEEAGISKDVDCISIFMSLENYAPKLYLEFMSLGDQVIKDEYEHIKSIIDIILNSIRKKTDSLIVWNLFTLPIYPPMGFIEDKNIGLIHFVNNLNNYIIARAEELKNIHVINTNRVLMKVGASNYYDKRMNYIARSLYGRLAQYEFSKSLSDIIRATAGKVKKVLILDCDNTLWGGVIGEDGVDGIKLGSSFPGLSYKEFQISILEMARRGVLLCLCSKNNPEDVWAVFDNNPNMVLKRDDIVSYRINWQDKASNIKEIAYDLNLGLESFVFIDDSFFECNLVKDLIPEVQVICLSDYSISEYSDVLKRLGIFDQEKYSVEDQRRVTMYKEESKRNELRAQYDSLSDYLSSLNMKLVIQIARDVDIPRVAQLTQRTNQFNLTTKRYTDDELLLKVQANEFIIFVASLEDRFGEYGKIGVCILDLKNKNNFFVDTYLLSCRALGRGVEYAFMRTIAEYCKGKKISCISSEYKSSNKNSQVSDFYDKMNFIRVGQKGTDVFYEYHLSNTINHLNTDNFCGTILFNEKVIYESK